MSDPALNWYTESRQFPETARKIIPRGRWTAIDEGSAGFFQGLESSFPETFTALLQRPSVRLLEWVLHRTTGMGEEVEDRLYKWAVPLTDALRLIGHIPSLEKDHPAHQRAQAKYLPHLPPGLAAFYEHSDGLTISEGSGLAGLDFPARLAGWLPLHEYYRQRELSAADPLTIMDDLGVTTCAW